MKVLPLVIVALFVGAVFAGCATPGASAKSLTLNRHVRFHLDNQNFGMDESDPYNFITSSFVVRVGESPLPAATAIITYTDKSGALVSKPLSTFINVVDLAPGTEVVIDDANITSDAVLKVNGETLASRSRGAEDWWLVGGYPIGFRMEPGSALSYAMTAKGREAMTLRDIESTTLDEPYRLDKLEASLAVDYSGTFDVTLADATESLVAARAHDARALAWSTKGTLTVPMLLDLAATNLSNGAKIEGGIEVLPVTGGSLDAKGKLWWNASHAPIRADRDSGSVTTNADVITWLTGDDRLGEFGCLGKSRADGCRPEGFSLEKANKTRTLEPTKINLDEVPWDVEQDLFANLTRALSEDLVAGDELRFDIDLDRDHLGEASTEDLPDPFTLRTTMVLRAVQDEQVTVPAGVFDAIKVVEQFDFKINAGETRDGSGELLFKAFSIEQRVVDTTFWLAKETFVPLRVQSTSPFDLNKVVDDLLNALPEGTWAQAPFKPLTGDNVDFVVQTTSTLELASSKGATSFSPWVALVGFHFAGGLPLLMAGEGVSDIGGFGDEDRDGDYEPVAEKPKSFSLASAGAIEPDHKDYVVVAATPMTYGDLAFWLDGEDLYESADAPGWCLLKGEECAQDAWFTEISEGDTLRILGEGLAGQTLSVFDATTNDLVLSLTIG